MLTQQTLDHLSELRLKDMLTAYQRQQSQTTMLELSFEERFGMLVEYEWIARKNRQLKRLLKQAHLRIPNACMEDIDYSSGRSLDRKLISHLNTLSWIQQHLNVLITGPSGVGKTYIANALGNAACRCEYTTRYYRVSRLLEELSISKADGSHKKLLRNLKKISVLILDDWGLQPFTTIESRELLEVVEDRYQHASTVIVSQLPVEKWNQVLTDPTLADAIMDRIINSAYMLKINGESMRKLKSQLPKEELFMTSDSHT